MAFSPFSRLSRRALAAIIWACLALCLTGAIAAQAQQPAQQAPQGQRPAPAQAAKPVAQKFTIKAIEPRPDKEELVIVFSRYVPLDVLRENLRLTPRTRITWHESKSAQNGQVVLKGAFRYGARYLVSLPEDLKVGDATFTQGVYSFFMPERKAHIEFLDARRIVERDSRQMIHLRARNVDSVSVETTTVPALLAPLAEAAQTDAKSAAAFADLAGILAKALAPAVAADSQFAPFFAMPETEKQLYAVRGEKNKDRPFSLPLSQRKQAAKGTILLVRATDLKPDGAAPPRPKIVGVTDLGLTYKRGKDQMLFWVTSLREAAPLTKVQLAGLTKDGQAFILGATDDKGVLLFSAKECQGLDLGLSGQPGPIKRVLQPAEISHVLAATKNDVTHMRLLPRGNSAPMGVRQFTPGEPIPGLRGMVFTERGVYRPGETVHFKGVVRQFKDNAVASPAGRKVAFTVTGPRGEVMHESSLDLSEYGTASADLATASHWPRGSYTLSMRYAPKAEKKKTDEEERDRDKPEENVATATFQVQEFRAPRHYTDLSFERGARPLAGMVNREGSVEIVRIKVAGSYYAGGPVKNGQVRWKIYGADTDYSVPGLDAYRFGYMTGDQERPVLIESGQDTLDESGQAVIEFPLDRAVLAGKAGLSVTASVVDFDGRAASATKLFQVEPKVFVGVSRIGKEAPAGSSVELSALAADAKGEKLTGGKFEAQLFERTYVETAKRNEKGDVIWDSERVWRKLRSQPLEAEGGLVRYRLDLAGYGDYMVVFAYTDKGVTSMSSTVVESSGSDYETSYEARKLPFTPLTLAADAKTYQPGQTARVIYRTGRPVANYLVTVERDGIFEYRVEKAKGDFETVTLPIKAEHAPNVYVSVLGVTPRGEFPAMSGRYDAEAPGYVLGSLDLPVRRDYDPLTVAIAADKPDLAGQPGQKMEIEITAKDKAGKPVDAEMAVAVVMESVLALTGYKTPVLTDLTRFDMPLGVFTGEMRALLVHQTPFYMARNEPLTGGDGGDAMDSLSKLRRRFSPVAFYKPSLRTGPEGKVTIDFVLPDSMTSYRVYAVACDKASAFASAERKLLAVKDFYLEPGLPDFFTKGDSFTFQVAAFNGAKAPGDVLMKLKVPAQLELTGPAGPVQVPAASSAKLPVTGKAVAAGAGAIEFSGTMGERADAVEAKVRVNAGTAVGTISTAGSIDGTGSVRAPQPAGKLAPELAEEATAAIVLSGSPYLRLSQAVRGIMFYPYGCVEQTASGVIALSGLIQPIAAGLVPEVDPAQAKAHYDKLLERLISMQLASGGFGYWPGARLPHPYGSLYGSLALAMAERARPGTFTPALKLSVNYLKTELDNPNRTAAFKAFAAYVLSVSGNLEKGQTDELDRNWAKQSRETKLFMVLAAQEAKLLPPAEIKRRLAAALGDADPGAKQYLDDEFRAVYRAPALALMAASAVAPRGPEEARTMQAVLSGMGEGGLWTSTSDSGLCLAALAQALAGVKFSNEPQAVTVTQQGGKSQTVTVDPKTGASLALDAKALLANPLVGIEAKAGQSLIYRVNLSLPRPDIDASGETKGISVRKTLASASGEGAIKVGDLVKVTVTVDVAGAPIRYLAVNDPLPAGLVGVNAAFKTEEPMPEPGEEEGEPDTFNYFTSDGAYRPRASHFEIRDDRALIFQDRTFTGAHVYEYYARAVCQGDFMIPSTKAEAMYQPNLTGSSPAGRLVVQGR